MDIPVHGFMTYRGDQRQILAEGPKGPNLLNEYLFPVVAKYDEETNTTRVGYTFLAPQEDAA